MTESEMTMSSTWSVEPLPAVGRDIGSLMRALTVRLPVCVTHCLGGQPEKVEQLYAVSAVG